MSICRDKRLRPRAEVQTHTHGDKINIWAPLWAAGHGVSEHTEAMQRSLGGHCVEAPRLHQTGTHAAGTAASDTSAGTTTPGGIARGGIGFPSSERAHQDKAHTHTHANFSCCPFYHSGKALVMVNHRKRALKLFSISIIIIIIIFLHCCFSMSFKKKKNNTPNQKNPDKQTNKPLSPQQPCLSLLLGQAEPRDAMRRRREAGWKLLGHPPSLGTPLAPAEAELCPRVLQGGCEGGIALSVP